MRWPPSQPPYDVIVVGAGPAGLSCGLILGRCRRRVLLLDSGRPRNWAASALHGFLSRDGTAPAELRALGRAELERYETVTVAEAEVTAAEAREGCFEVRTASGRQERARKLVLATGLEDELPDIPGLGRLYGRGVHHCPYCDAWEVRDQGLAVLGSGRQGVGLAEEITIWSRDVILCTNGVGLGDAQRRRLARAGVRVVQDAVERVEGEDRLEALVFAGGDRLPRTALFFAGAQRQRSGLPGRLGCELTEEGVVPCGEAGQTSVSGLYIVGDASRRLPVHFAIAAAAEGAETAAKINSMLLEEDLRAPGAGSADSST